MNARVLVQWNHPADGRRREVLCAMHEGEVLHALKILHIGCHGSPVSSAMTCERCDRGGVS